MPRDPKQPRLGRGLASLIPSSDQTPPVGEYRAAPADTTPPEATPSPPEPTATLMLPVDGIEPNPYQPRRDFDEPSLAALAATLREHGLLQPILVAAMPSDAGATEYRLIAGERRLRAAKLAGLSELPCIVRPASGAHLLELALVENLHRADLNPVERASAYRELIDRFALNQQEVADRLGEPRATIANHLRLLGLSEDVRELILSGHLTFGHAKVLAGVTDDVDLQRTLAKRCAQERLSVRQLEELLRSGQGRTSQTRQERGQRQAPSAYIRDVEVQLTRAVGTKVSIRQRPGKHAGQVLIDYYSLEDFDRIVGKLGAELES